MWLNKNNERSGINKEKGDKDEKKSRLGFKRD
jgi:hypothetical protein